jgi:hypothetical protein
MNQELMDMAKEAGMWEGDNCEFVANSEEVLEAFTSLVRAAEREKVAKQWEQWHGFDKHTPPKTTEAITAIKAALAQPAQQRPWVGLTHQETKDCIDAWDGNDAYVLCRAIEAKLKELNQ